VRAGERDCPQENQTLQAATDFRAGTSLSIVFICCCEASIFSGQPQKGLNFAN